MFFNTQATGTLNVKLVTVKSPIMGKPTAIRLIATFDNGRITLRNALFTQDLNLKSTEEQVNAAIAKAKQIANAKEVNVKTSIKF